MPFFLFILGSNYTHFFHFSAVLRKRCLPKASHPSLKSVRSIVKSQLKKTEDLTLVMVVCLLQMHKQVSIERLATVWPYPILFENRRKSLQRFFKLPALRIETLWFPWIEYILRTAFSPQKVLILAIDRTQWRQNNLFFISLIWEQRAIPLYWIILPKKGSSNLQEQQTLIAPVLSLLKDYQIILLGGCENLVQSS